MSDQDQAPGIGEAIRRLRAKLRVPIPRDGFGLETSWLIYNEARAEVADELSALLATLEATAGTKCQHCGHEPHPTITRSVVVDMPEHPVSGMCVLNGCQHMGQAGEATPPSDSPSTLSADAVWRRRWHARLGRGESESEGMFYDRLDRVQAPRLIQSMERYLKAGETPIECVERNRADVDSMLTLLADEKRKSEALLARAEAAEAKLGEATPPAQTDEVVICHTCQVVVPNAWAVENHKRREHTLRRYTADPSEVAAHGGSESREDK